MLVAGPDFGTGSSREHAVWALMDYGFKVVISSRFADIFRGNSGKAGLLAAQVSQDVVEQLWKLIEHDPTTQIVVDLEARTIQADAAHRTLRHRRLHALPPAQRSRRRGHHAVARGRHRGLRVERARRSSPSRSDGRPAQRILCHVEETRRFRGNAVAPAELPTSSHDGIPKETTTKGSAVVVRPFTFP